MKFVAFSADQALALNVSAAHEDFTSLSGQPPPGRGAGGEVVPGPVPQGERAKKVGRLGAPGLLCPACGRRSHTRPRLCAIHGV